MLDLNLIRTFVAVFETGSVSAAAKRLNITQPSVSYALQRLRGLLRDPLFTRTRDGMAPTFHATQLFATFKAAIDGIQDAIAAARQFDPSSASRCFRLALSDLGEAYFLPLLMRELASVAPSVALDIVQIDSEKIGGWLTTGHVDAAIGNLHSIGSEVRRQRLFIEDYCCVVSAAHPRIRAALTLEQYIEAEHVAVAPSTGHVVEDLLSEAGIKRKVMLRVPHFTSLVPLVASTGLVLTLPSRIAAAFAGQGGLRTLPLPFTMPSFDVSVYWHPHSEDAVAQRWFCETIVRALANV